MFQELRDNICWKVVISFFGLHLLFFVAVSILLSLIGGLTLGLTTGLVWMFILFGGVLYVLIPDGQNMLTVHFIVVALLVVSQVSAPEFNIEFIIRCTLFYTLLWGIKKIQGLMFDDLFTYLPLGKDKVNIVSRVPLEEPFSILPYSLLQKSHFFPSIRNNLPQELIDKAEQLESHLSQFLLNTPTIQSTPWKWWDKFSKDYLRVGNVSLFRMLGIDSTYSIQQELTLPKTLVLKGDTLETTYLVEVTIRLQNLDSSTELDIESLDFQSVGQALLEIYPTLNLRWGVAAQVLVASLLWEQFLEQNWIIKDVQVSSISDGEYAL